MILLKFVRIFQSELTNVQNSKKKKRDLDLIGMGQ